MSSVPAAVRHALPHDRPGEAARLEALRAGSDDAYRDLVAEYGPRLVCTARRIVRDEDEARDCVQEGLLRAFRALDSFEGRSSIYSWLFRIVTNVALQRQRAAARFSNIEYVAPREATRGWEVALGRHSASDQPDAIFQRSCERQLVREAVRSLSRNNREVIRLRDFDEQDTATTAERLGITPGAAKVRLHRARLALRKAIEDSDSALLPRT